MLRGSRSCGLLLSRVLLTSPPSQQCAVTGGLRIDCCPRRHTSPNACINGMFPLPSVPAAQHLQVLGIARHLSCSSAALSLQAALQGADYMVSC